MPRTGRPPGARPKRQPIRNKWGEYALAMYDTSPGRAVGVGEMLCYLMGKHEFGANTEELARDHKRTVGHIQACLAWIEAHRPDWAEYFAVRGLRRIQRRSENNE